MRIFIIGFNKCGTTSIDRLFRKNGLKIANHSFRKNGSKYNIAKQMFKNKALGRDLLDEIDGFDLYADIELNEFDEHLEANELFRELDQKYSDSKFILNLRDKDDWLRSREHHNGGKYLSKQMSFLGIDDPRGVIDIWSKKWDAHIKDVREYFADKPGKLLEFNIDNDDPAEIAKFFPQLNLDITHWGKYNVNKKLHASDG